MRTLQLRALGRFTTWYLLAQDMPHWPSVFVFVFFFFFKKITRYASLPLVGPFIFVFFSSRK